MTTHPRAPFPGPMAPTRPCTLPLCSGRVLSAGASSSVTDRDGRREARRGVPRGRRRVDASIRARRSRPRAEFLHSVLPHAPRQLPGVQPDSRIFLRAATPFLLGGFFPLPSLSLDGEREVPVSCSRWGIRPTGSRAARPGEAGPGKRQSGRGTAPGASWHAWGRVVTALLRSPSNRAAHLPGVSLHVCLIFSGQW